MRVLPISQALLLLITSQIAFGSSLHDLTNQRRQNDGDESEKPSPRPTTTNASKTISNSDTNENESPLPTRPSTRDPVTSGDRSSPSRTRTGTGNFVDPRLPPGGVVIKTPITTSGSLYYKIGEPVTFGWNYTSLVRTPTAVNVEAVCSEISQTYTIAQNVSFAKPSVVWDTAAYTPEKDQPPLAMGIYTLLIYDEQAEVTDIPSAGKLAAFNGLKFGMYTPRPYTPLSDFNCPTCETSDGVALDTVALRMIVIISVVTSLSFSWFLTLTF